MSESMGGMPVNNVSSGNIAGVGVGPSGEPGFRPKSVKVLRRKVQKIKENDYFAGNIIFDVDPERFDRARWGKRKYLKWSTYVEEDELGLQIREYGLKNPQKPIVLRNINSKEMLYLRYGNGK